MVAPNKVRASGETGADEEAKALSEEMDAPVALELPEETRRTHRTPGFARMRTDWNSQDRNIINSAKAAVDGAILRNFADAYQVMHEVYDLVRTPEVDEATGSVKHDQWGWPIWARNPSGGYIEDWTALGTKQRENLLFQITTRIFDWEQRAGDAWMEAMFAKAQWEESFALGFDAPMTGTVDDRKAAGNLHAREERYLAIFKSTYSRKADSIVRSMSLLAQRLKDTMS